MKKILLFCCLAVLPFGSELRVELLPARLNVSTFGGSSCLAVSAQEATESTQATTSSEVDEKAQQIREAVQEKIKSYTTGNPTAFVGAIKDIANSSLTLETRNGLKQASTSAETQIIRLVKKTKNEIEFADLEIKESVIAMGYLNENGALDIKRLIATDVEPPPAREIIFGKVSGVENDTLTIIDLKNQEESEIKITSKSHLTMKKDGETQDLESEEIGIDNRLIAICKPSADTDDPLTILRLHLLRQ